MQMLWLNFTLGLHLFIFLCYFNVLKYINLRKENGVLNQAKRKPQHKDDYIIKEQNILPFKSQECPTSIFSQQYLYVIKRNGDKKN